MKLANVIAGTELALFERYNRAPIIAVVSRHTETSVWVKVPTAFNPDHERRFARKDGYGVGECTYVRSYLREIQPGDREGIVLADTRRQTGELMKAIRVDLLRQADADALNAALRAAKLATSINAKEGQS